MTHNINTMTLELNAGKDPVFRTREDGSEWGSVFAIHNSYAKDKENPKTVPILVNIRGGSVNYAKKALKKGTRFITSGKLVHNSAEGKDFYALNADTLTVFPGKEES